MSLRSAIQKCHHFLFVETQYDFLPQNVCTSSDDLAAKPVIFFYPVTRGVPVYYSRDSWLSTLLFTFFLSYQFFVPFNGVLPFIHKIFCPVLNKSINLCPRTSISLCLFPWLCCTRLHDFLKLGKSAAIIWYPHILRHYGKLLHQFLKFLLINVSRWMSPYYLEYYSSRALKITWIVITTLRENILHWYLQYW